MDYTLDYMDYSLDYTENHTTDWSEARSVQSREFVHRGIRDVCVLSWGNFDFGTF